MSPPDDGDGVTRRSLLRGLVALPVLVTACGPDPGGGPDASLVDSAGTGATMCGPNLCIDLSNPVNATLNTVGGNKIFIVTGDRIIVIRTSTTAFTTLTSICTHAGCAVRYVLTSNSFACPCHGSKFAIDGAVTMGPAARPLKTYANTFDDAAMMVTVMLA